jgi:hypothetical protein
MYLIVVVEAFVVPLIGNVSIFISTRVRKPIKFHIIDEDEVLPTIVHIDLPEKQ